MLDKFLKEKATPDEERFYVVKPTFVFSQKQIDEDETFTISVKEFFETCVVQEKDDEVTKIIKANISQQTEQIIAIVNNTLRQQGKSLPTDAEIREKIAAVRG